MKNKCETIIIFFALKVTELILISGLLGLSFKTGKYFLISNGGNLYGGNYTFILSEIIITLGGFLILLTFILAGLILCAIIYLLIDKINLWIGWNWKLAERITKDVK